MGLILVQGPQAPVVDVPTAKTQMHVDTSADDVKIEMLLAAATQRMDGADGILGRALMPQTWQMQLMDWPAAYIEIPLPPLIRITSIAYLDPGGAEITLDPSLYRVVNMGSKRSRILRAIGTTWPPVATGQPDAVSITFDAGYEDAASPANNPVPEPIRQAIVLLADDWYNRGAQADLPEAVASLISPYRIARLGDTGYGDAETDNPITVVNIWDDCQV